MNSKDFDSILDEIYEKGKSLVKTLKGKRISQRTFFEYIDIQGGELNRWIKEGKNESEIAEERKQRQKRYTRACEARADLLFDRALEESSDETNDGEKGNKGLNSVKRSQLKVDTIKWAVGKLNPKKYNDRLQLDGGLDDEGESKAISISLKVNKQSKEKGK